MESIRHEFLISFLGDVEFEVARFRYNFDVDWLVVCLVWFVVWSKWSKISLQEFRLLPEFRCYDEVPGRYRMSEDGVYPSSVPSFLSGGCRVRSGPFQIQFWSLGGPL